MSYLGSPYRILYESRSLQSNLTLVAVRVLKPDGTVEGPFTMTELPAPFNGRYIYDYPSDPNGQEGSYFSNISSPMEGSFVTGRFELFKPWATSAQLQAFIDALQTQVQELVESIATLNGAVSTIEAAAQQISDDLEPIALLAGLIPSLVAAATPAMIKGGTSGMQIAGKVQDDNSVTGIVFDISEDDE